MRPPTEGPCPHGVLLLHQTEVQILLQLREFEWRAATVRIAYVTPYQGPTLITHRPTVRNRALSSRVKIELIAQLLHASGHDVEVFSHGEVDSAELRFYPALQELERFHPLIPVHYLSALPIRGLYGLWVSLQMQKLLDSRHRESPFDIIIIFNFKPPQLASKRYARRHGIPVILEYEDDVFRFVPGERNTFLVNRYHRRAYRRAMSTVSGCIGVSPYLLSQAPPDVPTMLLRGVVGDDVLRVSERLRNSKKNIILFSGTHNKVNGVEELIAAWRGVSLADWELHITGSGDLTDSVRRMAQDTPRVVFHGLLSRPNLVELMGSAKICISPQRVSQTPGDQFAFKVIEYLAAGAHVVMTPMGPLESEIEEGITYMADNRPETIMSTLQRVVGEQRYNRSAANAVHRRYGLNAVSGTLDRLLCEVTGNRQRDHS